MDIRYLIGETTEYDKKEKVEKRKPKSWCKSVSAFANGIGGILIFGVSDDGRIVGIEEAEKDSEFISETIKQRLNPIPNTNIRFVEEEGKKLIILEVYQGNQTPYYYDADGICIAYHRVGNESVKASPSKLQELVLKGSVTSYDAMKSKYDFNNMSFTKLKSVYNVRSGNKFEDSDYESFGLINEEGDLTNAGALIADESPIRQSRLFCTRWNGLDKAPGILDALDDKEFSGGLINLLQSGLEFVENNTKKTWKKTNDNRIESEDYPKRAVTEGLVNALIHRNYLELGSEVHIDLFDNRLEIYSPGGMCDGTKVQDRDLTKVPSRRRNPVIADIFNRLKYMDRRGSGFKKILNDYTSKECYSKELKPEFYSDNDCFILVLKNINYYEKKKSTLSSKTIEHQRKIIEFLKKNGESSNKAIAKAIGLSPTRTRAILNDMDEIKALNEYSARTYILK